MSNWVAEGSVRYLHELTVIVYICLLAGQLYRRRDSYTYGTFDICAVQMTRENRTFFSVCRNAYHCTDYEWAA